MVENWNASPLNSNLGTKFIINKARAVTGFFMPQEWHPHVCCWMGWPCLLKHGEKGCMVKLAYAEIAQAINQFEPVKMTARPEDAEEALKMCGTQIEIVLPMTTWTRDSGPTFIIDRKGKLTGIDWEFNLVGCRLSGL